MRDGLGVGVPLVDDPSAPGHGVAATRAADSAAGWVLLDHADARQLGAALAWARRRRIPAELALLVGGADAPRTAGVLARRAACFTDPPTVWLVEGRRLRQVTATPHGPLDDPEVPARFARAMEERGLEVVCEHGEVRAELLGLEVARMAGGQLAVGCGPRDQAARAMLTPGADPMDSLDEVVAAVRERRRAGAGHHPLNAHARQRWMRSVLLSDPSLAGAARLRPVAPVTRGADVPAPAVGADTSGRSVAVVCSAGVDADLVPEAADVRLREGTARLVLVVARGDDHPLNRALASRLVEPAEMVTLPPGWDGPGVAAGSMTRRARAPESS